MLGAEKMRRPWTAAGFLFGVVAGLSQGAMAQAPPAALARGNRRQYILRQSAGGGRRHGQFRYGASVGIELQPGDSAAGQPALFPVRFADGEPLTAVTALGALGPASPTEYYSFFAAPDETSSSRSIPPDTGREDSRFRCLIPPIRFLPRPTATPLILWAA